MAEGHKLSEESVEEILNLLTDISKRENLPILDIIEQLNVHYYDKESKEQIALIDIEIEKNKEHLLKKNKNLEDKKN